MVDTVTTARWPGRVAYGAIMFSSLFLAFILYRWLVPQVAMQVGRLPLPVSVDRVTGVIVYHMEYCKFIQATAAVHRELREVTASSPPRLYALPSSGFALPTGCHTVEVVDALPSYLLPGVYQLRLVFSYRSNAVSEPAVLETESFVIR